MTTCRAEYQWTADQLMDATWSHARNSSFRLVQWMFIGVGILSGLFGFAFWYTELKGLSIPLVLLSIFTIFLRKNVQNWQIRREFKNRKDQGLTISFDFSEDNVAIQSAHSQGTIGWDNYSNATQGKKGVILYQDTDRYHWIPASGFASKEDYDTFLNLAKTNIASFKVGK